jgi:triphosphoribosyl-dephospho-CoA synthase
MLTGDAVAAAYLDACLAELQAIKPGNVHVHVAGHGMTADDFVSAARASAPAIGDPTLAVGARILEAVRRSRAAIDCNTNLGILLLCAPLAGAAMMPGGDFEARLRKTLRALTVVDAEAAYAAIRLARPGGLGSSARHDVAKAPAVTLRDAMAAAAERDSIARQYVGDFCDVFAIGLPALRQALEKRRGEPRATAETYLAFLSRLPDSHIVRKHGIARALAVRDRARDLANRLLSIGDRAEIERALLRFDGELKAEHLNPGTSADLTVATLFLRRLLEAEASFARQ